MPIDTTRMGKPDIVDDQVPDSADVHAQRTRLTEWFNRGLQQTDGRVCAALVHLGFEVID